MTTDHRIDRLERQLRGLRAALFLAIAALAGAVALGLAAPGDQGDSVVSANRFLLMSKDGQRILGSWAETPDGFASFALYNAEGHRAFDIVLDNAGHGHLTLRGTDGASLLVLSSIDGGDPDDAGSAATFPSGPMRRPGSGLHRASLGISGILRVTIADSRQLPSP